MFTGRRSRARARRPANPRRACSYHTRSRGILPYCVRLLSLNSKDIYACTDATFYCSVTEQPFKIPFYAALLRSLYEPVVKTEEDVKTENETESDDKTVGAKILDEFVRGFLSYLDSAAWRETRFCVSQHSSLSDDYMLK
jgi:hypothetical protein